MTLLLSVLGFLHAGIGFAAIGSDLTPTKEGIDKLMTFALGIGRATGCGIDTIGEMRLVDRWIEFSARL